MRLLEKFDVPVIAGMSEEEAWTAIVDFQEWMYSNARAMSEERYDWMLSTVQALRTEYYGLFV